MPPKRKGGKKHHSNKPSTSTTTTTTATAISDTTTAASSDTTTLPPEIITFILKRLPVKSIVRFKCVSKPWLALFSSPKFISMHLKQTFQNPRNHSFIIHSIDEVLYHNMSLLNINSTAAQPVSLINPFPVLFQQMDLVGSINGVVCLSCPPLGHMIVLWNPAMNLYKYVSLSGRNLCEPGESPEKISLGFGYDSLNEDYKIIRIALLKRKITTPGAPVKVYAEVYSANLDSWKRVVQIDTPFFISQTRSNVIAKGIPYWAGIVYQATTGNLKEVLLYYDMLNDKFKHVPVPKFDGHAGTGVRFVEWKGNLGLIMTSPSKDRANFADILVYDEIEACWKKVSSHGPIPVKVRRDMQCSKDGVILAETPEGKLVLYDPVSNGIKEFYVHEAMKLSFEAASYVESLVSFKKMEQVKEQDKDKFCVKSEDLGEDATTFQMGALMKTLEHSLESGAFTIH